MPTTPPAQQCLRCSKSDSSVHRVLLTCVSCTRSWHHRCHIPPVTDQELITRLKASTFSAWCCRRCTNNSRPAARTTPQLIEVLDSPSPSARSLPIDQVQIIPAYIVPAAPDNHIIDLSGIPDDSSPLDLTALSDRSLDEASHFSGLSIHDASHPDDDTMDAGPEQGSIFLEVAPSSMVVQDANVDAFLPDLEWNTSQVHQSIPEVAPLSWMRQALQRRQECPNARPGRKRTAQQVPNSGRLYINGHDFVTFVQYTSL